MATHFLEQPARAKALTNHLANVAAYLMPWTLAQIQEYVAAIPISVAMVLRPSRRPTSSRSGIRGSVSTALRSLVDTHQQPLLDNAHSVQARPCHINCCDCILPRCGLQNASCLGVDAGIHLAMAWTLTFIPLATKVLAISNAQSLFICVVSLRAMPRAS